MSNIAIKPFELYRKDGKIINVELYNFTCINDVAILDIKQLKFEGIAAKDIKKSDIHNAVLKDKNKLYFQNKYSKMVAGLSKKHLNKIISTVFTKDTQGKFSYLKKEIVANVDLIFYAAVPILKHAELKKEVLYDYQIIHRFAVPLKIGGLEFLTMITVKERTDSKDTIIDEFAIYDLYSEVQNNKNSLDSPSTVSIRTFRSQYQVNNKKSSDSPSTVSVGNTPMTTRSHYQMTNHSIYDLFNFVKCSITKLQQ